MTKISDSSDIYCLDSMQLQICTIQKYESVRPCSTALTSGLEYLVCERTVGYLTFHTIIRNYKKMHCKDHTCMRAQDCHCSDYAEYHLLGCDAKQSGRRRQYSSDIHVSKYTKHSLNILQTDHTKKCPKLMTTDIMTMSVRNCGPDILCNLNGTEELTKHLQTPGYHHMSTKYKNKIHICYLSVYLITLKILNAICKHHQYEEYCYILVCDTMDIFTVIH